MAIYNHYSMTLQMFFSSTYNINVCNWHKSNLHGSMKQIFVLKYGFQRNSVIVCFYTINSFGTFFVQSTNYQLELSSYLIMSFGGTARRFDIVNVHVLNRASRYFGYNELFLYNKQ